MPNNSLKIFLIIALALTSNACLADEIKETEVQYIPLAPPLDRAKAQISGMTWCGETLLLLPERPWFEIAEDNPDPKDQIATFIYQLSRDQIDHYLSDKQSGPLIASKIKLEENGVRKNLKYFDGYEAIVCSNDKIWLSIETEVSEDIFETNIVAATLSKDGSKQKISIDPSTLYRIESQSGIRNYSDESLLLVNNNLISIHEANNTTRETSSYATHINSKTGKSTKLRFPSIAYRITDATDVDSNGYFWAINYAWSGELKWFTKVDSLTQKYAKGETHKLEKTVERLIQFRLSDAGIDRVEQTPIQLKLTQEDGRNWEGIVRYRAKGLLLVTDQHPRTLLGFVPFDQ